MYHAFCKIYISSIHISFCITYNFIATVQSPVPYTDSDGNYNYLDHLAYRRFISKGFETSWYKFCINNIIKHIRVSSFLYLFPDNSPAWRNAKFEIEFRQWKVFINKKISDIYVYILNKIKKIKLNTVMEKVFDYEYKWFIFT